MIRPLRLAWSLLPLLLGMGAQPALAAPGPNGARTAMGTAASVAVGVGVGAPASGAASTAPATSATTTPAGMGVIGTALRITDGARSTRFYTQGLGMTLARRIDRPDGAELIFTFGSPGPAILLNLPKDSAVAKPVAPDYGHVMLSVTDADALVARLTAAGYAPGAVHADALTKTKNFWIKDPDGYAYEIVQRPAR
ncbi:VOC family protein [Sphingobium sufflavum]|uniref:VOC family protein n=1 Tax=Sphingobium sufflavum TaxID=1129547 RepID=UPI001F2AC234|nr:VOC family protein [Sphingobium sufflavum]MCE7796228.1 VOC family protein [Sphingobium sufflavum]